MFSVILSLKWHCANNTCWTTLKPFENDVVINKMIILPHRYGNKCSAIILLVLLLLGGLSLHLNHLIASCMKTFYQQFGTLHIGILLSNLDWRQLETSLMTSYGYLWLLATPGPFEYFCQNWVPSESQSFFDEGATIYQWALGVLGGQMTMLDDGTIFGRSVTHIRECHGQLHFSAHSRWLKGYSGFTDLIKHQCIGVA